MLIACITVAHADLNSKQRLRAFAALPNWPGYWENRDIATGPVGAPLNMSGFVAAFATPPYNAEWKARFDKAEKEKSNGATRAYCTLGFPALMVAAPVYFQVMITPEETMMVFSYREVRHVFTDGRPHPKDEDQWATPWGHSIGKWEGQTLMIDTVATSSGVLVLNDSAFEVAPLSDHVHIIERMRMLDKDTLEDQITVDDPTALVQPWIIKRHYGHVTDIDRIVDADCTGNHRNPVIDGHFTIAPPNP